MRRNLIWNVASAAAAAVLAFAMVQQAQAAPQDPPTGRGPNDSVPAGSTAIIGDDQLIFFTRQPDGGGALAIYDGVASPRALLDSLKARGLVDRAIATVSRTDDAATAPPAKAGGPSLAPQALPTVPDSPEIPAECVPPSGSWNYNYGTARYWADGSCGLANRIRWNTNGLTDPRVYFHDHTGNRWNVTTAISMWNNGCSASTYNGSPTCGVDPRVDLVWSGSSCPVNCVHVYEATYGETWHAYTYAVWNTNHYFISGAVNIHFNNSALNNAHWNQLLPCHEIGHALGLSHPLVPGTTPPLDSAGRPVRPQTCLSPADNFTNKHPHSRDLSMLRDVLYV